jgi:hypothetical protein
VRKDLENWQKMRATKIIVTIILTTAITTTIT